MKLEPLFLLHLMAGVGVAVCVYLAAPSNRVAARWFQTITAVFFWPLFLPLLLSHRAWAENRAVTQSDAELEMALATLDRWAANIRVSAQVRLQELRSAWAARGGPVGEMDKVLVQSRDIQTKEDFLAGSEQVRGSQDEQSGQERQWPLDDLLGFLARLRDLASMIRQARCNRNRDLHGSQLP